MDEAAAESFACAKCYGASAESIFSLVLVILSFLFSTFHTEDAALGFYESEPHAGVPILDANRWTPSDRVGRSPKCRDRHRGTAYGGDSHWRRSRRCARHWRLGFRRHVAGWIVLSNLCSRRWRHRMVGDRWGCSGTLRSWRSGLR